MIYFTQYNIICFTDATQISPKLSLHPVHLIPDKEGNIPPSALIPFCSYQGDFSLLGHQLPELGNITTCDKFEPRVLDGQLCYTLDVTMLAKKQTRSGKTNGLFILLDPNPYSFDAPETSREDSTTKHQSFKVFIHTLAQHTSIGPGSYGMTALKKMTHTKSFEHLPGHQKKCLVHNREECQTKTYLDQVENDCKCIPWALVTRQKRNQVRAK